MFDGALRVVIVKVGSTKYCLFPNGGDFIDDVELLE